MKKNIPLNPIKSTLIEAAEQLLLDAPNPRLLRKEKYRLAKDRSSFLKLERREKALLRTTQLAVRGDLTV